jgi:hypothetical protein
VSGADEPGADVPPPSAGALERLPSDEWAALLPAVRSGLQALDGADATPTVRRLRAAPTGRLAGGRVRRELCELLARGGDPWRAVLEALREAPSLPPALAGLVRGEGLTTSAAAPSASAAAGSSDAVARARKAAERARAEADRARDDADRARARLRETRDERDAARRRADGAERRAASAEAALTQLRSELRASEARGRELEQTLAETAAEHRRALEREARRRDAEVDRLRDELAALRRAEEEQRLAARRREEARQQAERVASESAAEARRAARDRGASRVRPGRPSTLPEGMRADTPKPPTPCCTRGGWCSSTATTSPCSTAVTSRSRRSGPG